VPPPDTDLPPVGPTPPPPRDRIGEEFKAAQLAHKTAQQQARADLQEQFNQQRQEMVTTGADAAKDPGIKELSLQQQRFGQRGTLPTHPAMQAAVATYCRVTEAARKTFTAAVDQALADYEKAGIKEPAKIQPLLAYRTGLIGIWERELAPHFGELHREVWIIDVDPHTGEWHVDGIDGTVSAVMNVYHGEKVHLKKGVLFFVACRVDSKTHLVAPDGVPCTLKFQQGKLRVEMNSVPQPAVAILEHSEDEECRKRIAYHQSKKAVGGSDTPAAPLDLADPTAVWRELATLASFAHYRGQGQGPFPEAQELFIPYRGSNMTVTPGPYGFMTDLLTGSKSGAGVNRKRTELLLQRHDRLEEASHPYLKRAAEHARAICRARLQLGEANDDYGNTPTSAMQQFRDNVLAPGLEFCLSREGDRARIQEEVDRKYPDTHNILVGEIPYSERSHEKLQETWRGIAGLKDKAMQGAVVSGMLGYADMTEVDRLSAFWQSWLLPLARRCGGPTTEKPLLSVDAIWRQRSSRDRFQRLAQFLLRNISGQELTHVVVEVTAENPWGERASHYCYIPQLDLAEMVWVLPHPRWDKRRLDFTNWMNVSVSVWADQGTDLKRQTRLASPAPNRDPEGWRRDYLGYDRQYATDGEALGKVLQTRIALPANPERQRRLLREAAAAGNTYLFRLAVQGKPARTLVLRMRRMDADGTAEAEIFDLANRQPFRADTPLWKTHAGGKMGSALYFSLNGDFKTTGWAFVIGEDDRPHLFCPLGGKPGAVFPAREIALFPVKLP
jgi:hypothetical protein